MALYAHAIIEVPVDMDDPDAGVTRYERGDVVPADLPGIDDLIDGESVAETEYDPAADEVESPEVVEIDGHRYVKARDNGQGEDNAAR